MGKGMKAGKRKNPENGLIRKAKREATDEALHKCTAMFLAYMMEEEGYTDPEKLMEMWDSFNRWCEYMKDPQILSVRKIEKILKEHTGITIDWRMV